MMVMTPDTPNFDLPFSSPFERSLLAGLAPAPEADNEEDVDEGMTEEEHSWTEEEDGLLQSVRCAKASGSSMLTCST